MLTNLTARPATAAFQLAWSTGRRHHQAIAHACHIKRQQADQQA
jgi:hypothetical protein